MKNILFSVIRIKLFVIALVLLCSSVAVQATELLTWDRMPLAVPLVVGQERVIHVDKNVRVGLPGSLTGKLRVQTTGGSVYLMALEPIPPTRIQLQDAESGALILMDIAADEAQGKATASEPIQIVEGVRPPVRYGQPGQPQRRAASPGTTNGTSGGSQSLPVGVEEPQALRETPIPVILTRFAAQNLYAPLRTVEPVAGISRVNVRGKVEHPPLLPSLPLKARALASWRLEDYWVTAVMLKNSSRHPINLDPRLLQGDFITATFQHSDLGPSGDATDTTVVYIVTRKHGLMQSILPAISTINSQSNISGDPYEK